MAGPAAAAAVRGTAEVREAAVAGMAARMAAVGRMVLDRAVVVTVEARAATVEVVVVPAPGAWGAEGHPRMAPTRRMASLEDGAAVAGEDSDRWSVGTAQVEAGVSEETRVDAEATVVMVATAARVAARVGAVARTLADRAAA